MIKLLVSAALALILCGAGVAAAHDTGKPHSHAAKAKKKKPAAKPTGSSAPSSATQPQGTKNSGWGTGN
jgi:hypothetical protein